jgi:hypothetical protein
MNCLTPTTATTYTETPPNSLQELYYVIAQDANGDLSSPSNVVGGPSLAVTQCSLAAVSTPKTQ